MCGSVALAFATLYVSVQALHFGWGQRYLTLALLLIVVFGVSTSFRHLYRSWRFDRLRYEIARIFFLLVVTTISLPNLPSHAQDRFAWILTVRETAFACGALVLAGSVWPSGGLGNALVRIGSSSR